MRIGFFDSGLGGLTIFKEAIKKYKAEYIYFGDIKNSPYGVKPKEEIKKYIFENVKYLVENGCKVIVIACNTATSVAILELREMYPNICFIGTEPAVKPAVLLNNNKKILVMATSLTLKEKKLHDLVKKLDAEERIVFLPMDKLVRFAEECDNINYSYAYEYIKEKFKEFDFSEFSSVVLGCTHFPLFREEFKKNLSNDIEIIDSAEGVVNNMINNALKIDSREQVENKIEIVVTKENFNFLNKASKILETDKEKIVFKII